MSSKVKPESVEVPENQEDLQKTVKGAATVLREKFKNFAGEVSEFEKEFQERRKKFKDGTRRRTSGRIV